MFYIGRDNFLPAQGKGPRALKMFPLAGRISYCMMNFNVMENFDGKKGIFYCEFLPTNRSKT